jgi:hypothetical protein
MAKNRNIIPPSVSDTSRPETDFEHGQRFLSDIDRRTWQGTHPPSHPGPRGIVHKMAVAENVPHIYSTK